MSYRRQVGVCHCRANCGRLQQSVDLATRAIMITDPFHPAPATSSNRLQPVGVMHIFVCFPFSSWFLEFSIKC